MNIEYYPADQFHARRRQGIGGSDVAAIVGVSKWKTPLQVYMEKKGLAELEEENQAMRMGKKLEPIIVELYKEKNISDLAVEIITGEANNGKEKMIVEKGDYYYFHPDGLLINTQLNDVVFGGFEAKTSRVMKNWGFEPDEVPMDYILQVQWGMFVCELPFFDLAVLLQGNEYRQYRIERNEETVEWLKGKVDTFWCDNILKSIPPDPIGEKADRELLNALYAETATQTQADVNCLEYIEKLQSVSVDLKNLEGEKLLYQNLIKTEMGDNQELINPSHKITWKSPKDKVAVNWKAIAEQAIAELTDTGNWKMDEKRYWEVLNNFISEKSEVKPSNRRFTFNLLKEE